MPTNIIFNFYNVNNVLIRNINFFRHLSFKYEIKQSSFAIYQLFVGNEELRYTTSCLFKFIWNLIS